MKHIFPLGLLALLAMGCSSINPAVSTQKLNLSETAPTSIAQSNSSPNPADRRPTSQSRNLHQSIRFGFQFRYPNGYVVDNSQENWQPKPGESLQGALDIWKSADYQAIKKPNFEGGEFPPNINISVHSNADQIPLLQWKNRLSIGSSSVRTIAVAGQEAIAYRSDGLYGLDNILLASPDSRSVIHLSRGYIDPSDPSQQAFQQIVSSFRFNR
jgi:hypothetical protein